MIKKMELYKNVDKTWDYVYPTPYLYQEDKPIFLKLVNNTSTEIKICGIPDGVDPIINYTLIEKNMPKRLFIMSDTPINNEELNVIYGLYGKRYYPIRQIQPIINDPIKLQYYVSTQFLDNFFTTTDDNPSNISKFLEYRYFSKRHLPASKLYVPTISGDILCNFILPKNKANLIIIMPENFIQTEEKAGYFKLDNNIHIRIYSKCNLSSVSKEIDNNLTTIINNKNETIVKNISDYISKLNFTNVTITENQIIGTDNLFTAVIGTISNLNFN